MSKELRDLIAHLSNLSKNGVKTASFDVNFLLGVLGQPIPTMPNKQQTQTTTTIDVDGGTFEENE